MKEGAVEVSARSVSTLGFLFAVGAAATFALSGIFASALMDAGWSPGAAVTLRTFFAAVILATPTVLMMRGRWRLLRHGWSSILWFGVIAVAFCQLCFFLAVELIPPSLALLIEYMGPVILMLWTWARTRNAPSWLTLLGAAAAVGGLVIVSGFAGGSGINPLGVLFALGAAVGNAFYFATAATSSHGIPPLPFVGMGLSVGAVILIVLAPIGVLPFAWSSETTTFAGAPVAPAFIVAGLAIFATVIPYLLGVMSSRRLGAVVASFTGYAEALFGIVWTIVFLAVVPTGNQWIGAALIVAGVVGVKAGELLRARQQHAVITAG